MENEQTSMWVIIYTLKIDYYININGEANTTLSTMDITSPKVVALTQVETEKSNDIIACELLAA